jgi:hypothetical protein
VSFLRHNRVEREEPVDPWDAGPLTQTWRWDALPSARASAGATDAPPTSAYAEFSQVVKAVALAVHLLALLGWILTHLTLLFG